MRPQAFLVETGDFAQRVVAAAMGVTGEIIQRLEFAEDRDIDRSAEGLFQFVESGGLAAQEQGTQFIGAKGERSHNIIVPATYAPYVRNYNKSTRPPPPPAQARDSHACKGFRRLDLQAGEEQ